ncbi:MAG: TetR/AcrR family transcriptional regulator [Anaerolineales bacterium]
MPKETFFNLPEEKRGQITEAALDEFATLPYAQASVNRIVERAGISKGSFYQYFQDKEDLFLYLLARMGEEKMAYLAPTFAQAGQLDFFALLRSLYVGGLRFSMAHPRYAAIGEHLLRAKNTPIFERVVHDSTAASQAYFRQLLQQAIARGEVRPDVDLDLMGYLMGELNTLIMAYYAEHVSPSFDNRLLETVDRFIDFMRRGLGPASESTHSSSQQNKENPV